VRYGTPAYGGWHLPLRPPYADVNLKGLEIIFRIKPNGNLLTHEPIPGQPWPEFMISNRNTLTGDLDGFTVEMDLRATDQYGQDQTLVNFAGGSPILFYLLGTWVQYSETAPGNGIWEAGTSTGNVTVFTQGGGPGSFSVELGATTCNITQSRTGHAAYSPGSKNVSLVMGAVSPTAFSGDGSVSSGGTFASGELLINCLKYANENVQLTLSSSSSSAVPTQGVVLSDLSVGGRSPNIGVQLSYCLSGTDYYSAQQGVQNCPTVPFPLGVDVGGARPPGIAYYKTGGTYRFGGNTYKDPDLDVGNLHVYLQADYYQVGPGAAQPGVVQATYMLTLDNL
jgi:hypothetical protein